MLRSVHATRLDSTDPFIELVLPSGMQGARRVYVIPISSSNLFFRTLNVYKWNASILYTIHIKLKNTYMHTNIQYLIYVYIHKGMQCDNEEVMMEGKIIYRRYTLNYD